nr:regulator of G protein signaling 4 [Hymenolepis microstoma]
MGDKSQSSSETSEINPSTTTIASDSESQGKGPAPGELTILRGSQGKNQLSNNSAFFALQNTVRNCIPVVLPPRKNPWDVVLEPLVPFKGLQRVSSDENIAASFRVKKVHLKKVTAEQIRRWETNFGFLLNDPDGLALFEKFLESEFSQENIQFWEACEKYRRLPAKYLAQEAQKIYQLYLSVQSPREVNLDSKTRLSTISLLSTPTVHLFDNAQRKIQALMEKDSYQRFLRVPLFLDFKKSVIDEPSCPPTKSRTSPQHKKKPPATTIQSALPSVINITTLPLGRKPF